MRLSIIQHQTIATVKVAALTPDQSVGAFSLRRRHLEQ